MSRKIVHGGSIVRRAAIVNPIVKNPPAANVVNANVSKPDFKTQTDSGIDNVAASNPSGLLGDNKQQNISGRMIKQKVDQNFDSKRVLVDDQRQKLIFGSSSSACAPDKKICFNLEEDEEIVVEAVITAGQIKPASSSANKPSVPIISTRAAVKRKSPFSSDAVAGTKSSRIVPVKAIGKVVIGKALASSSSLGQQSERIVTQKTQSTKTVPIAAKKSFPAPVVRKAAAVNPIVIKKQPTAAAIQNHKSGGDRGIVLKPIGNLIVNKRDGPIVMKSPAHTGSLGGGNLVVNKSQSASNISPIVRKTGGIVSSRRTKNGGGGDPIVKNKRFVVQGKPVVQSISNRVMKPLGSSSTVNESSSKPLVVVAKQQFGTIMNKPLAARPVSKGGCIVGSHRIKKSAASGVIKSTVSYLKLSSYPIADVRRKPSRNFSLHSAASSATNSSTPEVISIDRD